GLEVCAATDEIENAVFEGVEEQAIDREVTAFGVFLRGGELDFGGASAVEVGAVGAEGGDFDDALAQADEDDTEGLPHGLRDAEERADFGGRGIGGDVVVLGLQA